MLTQRERIQRDPKRHRLRWLLSIYWMINWNYSLSMLFINHQIQIKHKYTTEVITCDNGVITVHLCQWRRLPVKLYYHLEIHLMGVQVAYVSWEEPSAIHDFHMHHCSKALLSSIWLSDMQIGPAPNFAAEGRLQHGAFSSHRFNEPTVRRLPAIKPTYNPTKVGF